MNYGLETAFPYIAAPKAFVVDSSKAKLWFIPDHHRSQYFELDKLLAKPMLVSGKVRKEKDKEFSLRFSYSRATLKHLVEIAANRECKAIKVGTKLLKSSQSVFGMIGFMLSNF